MLAKEIVAQARAYQRDFDAPPADALLSVLIDQFTGEAADEQEPLEPSDLERARERLTRGLDVPEWLLASKALSDGIDVLADNLIEAGRLDLAAELGRVHAPRFDAGQRSPDFSPELLRQPAEPAPPPDERLWLPRPAHDLHPRGA